MHHPGGRQAIFEFRVFDTVAAEQQRSGLMDFIQPPGQDGLKVPGGHCLPRVTDNVQGGDRPPSHGINIAQGIGRRNLAKGIRIIDDRRKKIHRLDQGELRRQPEDAGIIGPFQTYQQIRMGLQGQAFQDFLQFPGRNLGSSARRPHLF